MDLSKLAYPFQTSQIHWRIGHTNADKTSAMALAYLDARDVMDRLDKVCGPEGWQSKHNWSDGKKLQCSIGINVTAGLTQGGQDVVYSHIDTWVWKSDGAGDTAVEGDKGAFSDAFKRAAVSWGIGRYLYQTPSWWVPVIMKGNRPVLPDPSVKTLNQNMSRHLLPNRKEMCAKALEENEDSISTILGEIAIYLSNQSGGGDYSLSTACEAWNEISEDDRHYLWLGRTDGGVFDQQYKKVIQSSEFRI